MFYNFALIKYLKLITLILLSPLPVVYIIANCTNPPYDYSILNFIIKYTFINVRKELQVNGKDPYIPY